MDIFSSAYGYKPLYVIAENDGEVLGICPLFEVKSLVFGRSLKSMPFHSEGGIYADSEEVLKNIYSFMRDMQQEMGITSLDIKTSFAPETLSGELNTYSKYYRYVTDMGEDSDALFRTFKEDVRTGIRKAGKNGIEVTISSDIAQLERLHRLMLRWSKSYGLPAHPLSFFKNILETFAPTDSVGISIATLDGKDIAGKLFLIDTSVGYTMQNWSALDYAYKRLKPNNLLLWEEMKYCMEKGIRYFDFGVTAEMHKDSRFFKSRWASEEQPVYFNALSGKKSGERDDHDGFQLARKVWKMMPQPMLKIMNANIMRHLA